MAVRAFSSIRSRFTICSLVLACITWIAGGLRGRSPRLLFQSNGADRRAIFGRQHKRSARTNGQ